MIKQEEIRKEVWKFIHEYDTAKGDPAVDWAFILLYRLSERGVVIKVSEISEDLAQTAAELPQYFARGKNMALISTGKTAHVFKEFKDMGYVAVEPLVQSRVEGLN